MEAYQTVAFGHMIALDGHCKMAVMRETLDQMDKLCTCTVEDTLILKEVLTFD